MPLTSRPRSRAYAEVQESPDGAVTITHLSLAVKVGLTLFVCVPQSICAYLLYWTGAKFLFFTNRMDILIMKAISLSFILQLDELLFATFASVSTQLRLEKASYEITRSLPNRDWHIWGQPLVKYLVTSGLTLTIVYIVFGDITQFRRACQRYFVAFPDTTPVHGATPFWVIFFQGLDITAGA